MKNKTEKKQIYKILFDIRWPIGFVLFIHTFVTFLLFFNLSRYFEISKFVVSLILFLILAGSTILEGILVSSIIHITFERNLDLKKLLQLIRQRYFKLFLIQILYIASYLILAILVIGLLKTLVRYSDTSSTALYKSENYLWAGALCKSLMAAMLFSLPTHILLKIKNPTFHVGPILAIDRLFIGLLTFMGCAGPIVFTNFSANPIIALWYSSWFCILGISSTFFTLNSIKNSKETHSHRSKKYKRIAIAVMLFLALIVIIIEITGFSFTDKNWRLRKYDGVLIPNPTIR